MRRLRIAIDPRLKERYGPEICWAWRLLLSSVGIPWEEVVLNGSESDIAYLIDHERADHCRLYVRANLEAWAQRSHYRLATVGHCDGWSHPVYEGEPARSRPIQAVDGRLVCERDVIFDVFWLATGQEERRWRKNKHGHCDLRGTAFLREHALRLALASSIGSGLQGAFLKLGFPPPVPRWPHGKQAAACVGHDVDYPEVLKWLEPMRILRRQGFRGLPAAVAVLKGDRNHWHFPSWVQLEQRLNTRSAFYFVARQGSLVEYAGGTPDPFYDVRSERFKALFRYLLGEGCEIGLHASYRACESQDQFAAEKRALEDASEQHVRGNRHHYWHINPEDPESTLLMHDQVGLTYDTSMIHERYVGWRRGLSWPFFPFHQEQRRQLGTLQIPTAWMDDQLFGHRNDNPGDRFEILRDLADVTAGQGGCLLVDIHDYVFDEVLFPEWREIYKRLWTYLSTRSDFWIDTPGRIADHWIGRYAAIIQSSAGLTG